MTRIIAHRGARLRHLENTLPAFKRAIEGGADGLEADIRLTKDGVPVVFHDPDLLRIAGRKEQLLNLTFTELGALPLFTKGKNPFTIPTLEDLLSLVATWEKASQRPLILILDVKTDTRAPHALVQSVLKALTKIPRKGPVILSSFSMEVLAQVKAQDPKRKTAFITEASPSTLKKQLSLEDWTLLDYLHPKMNALRRPWLLQYARFGRPLHLWTVNQPPLAKVLQHSAVAGIITDNPEGLLRVLDRPS